MKRLIILAALPLVIAGCRSGDTGSSTVVGERFAFPEFSNADGSVKVRVFENIKGASIWTAKDSLVRVRYENAYTNTYFGIATMRDGMKLDVTIEPLSVEAADAEAAKTKEVKSNGEQD